MTGQATPYSVTEQELHMPVGAYDEVHHPHGYVHAREGHHWYWFAGVAVSVIAVALISAVWWDVYSDRAPLCSRTVDSEKTSPDGSLVLSLAHVSCFHGAPEQKLYVRAQDSAADKGKAVASFDNDARVRVRWASDTSVAIAKHGGKVWFFEPSWKNVHFHVN